MRDDDRAWVTDDYFDALAFASRLNRMVPNRGVYRAEDFSPGHFGVKLRRHDGSYWWIDGAHERIFPPSQEEAEASRERKKAK